MVVYSDKHNIAKIVANKVGLLLVICYIARTQNPGEKGKEPAGSPESLVYTIGKLYGTIEAQNTQQSATIHSRRIKEGKWHWIKFECKLKMLHSILVRA